MSDMRPKQPEAYTLDLRDESFGNYKFGALIRVSPYSSLKPELVYPQRLTVSFRADDMKRAHGFAQSISAAISLGHDVWQTTIEKIWREPS